MNSYSDLYQKGLELAESGNHQQALECLQQFLNTSPNNPEALNDVGAILHCLGRSEEAINYFIRARSVTRDNGEILWNLVEAYLSLGRAKEASRLFKEMDELGLLNTDVINRTATMLLDQGDKANAIEVLLNSFKKWPEQKVLKPMIDVIRLKRPKVAFFCGGDGMTFLHDILAFIRERFEVRIFEGQTEQDLREMMEWSDISWFEWCTNLAVMGSHMPKVCKTIVRLHRYEAYEQWPSQVNWANVDVLVTVGNKVTQRKLLEAIPDLESQTLMVSIPNGVNLETFEYINRPKGKNIAYLANLRMVKNPALMLQCMQKLHYLDPEYHLFFGGRFMDHVLEQYVRQMVKALKLEGVVHFDGWIEDVNAWLRDKHFIVSTSICEGHPVNILEAMAAGLKPVIHNFLGAEQIFPSDYLFNIAEQFCENILSDHYDPMSYRKFVEDHYSLEDQLKRVNDIFTRFEIELETANHSAAKDLNMSIDQTLPVESKVTL